VVAIRADGSLVAWGDPSEGVCDVPTSSKRFVQVAAGRSHDLGLLEDGSVVGWGRTYEHQCVVPEPNQDFVDIAVLDGRSLGLKRDGRVVAWGDYSNYLSLPDGGVVDLDANAANGLYVFLKSDGSVSGNGAGIPQSERNVAIAAGGSTVVLKASNALMTESFDHGGAWPTGWTCETQSPLLSEPWAVVTEGDGDWALQTTQPAYGLPQDQWLVTPVLNLAGAGVQELRFTSSGLLGGAATAQVKYSVNGGLSWSTLTTWTAPQYQYQETLAGAKNLSLPTMLGHQANARLAFVFHPDFLHESWWGLDDWRLIGQADAPLANAPTPSQPPSPTPGLARAVGCTWSQPMGVNGASLELRWDANGDGDYDDGGVERWHRLPEQPDAATAAALDTARWSVFGENLRFELRARSGVGAWGYSGQQGQPGIWDDWAVALLNPPDSTPPAFSAPLPDAAGQAGWLAQRTQTIGCTITDAESGVDAASLAMRVDWDGNGQYTGPSEGWQPLTGYVSGPVLTVRESLTFPADGTFRVEFRAQDLAGNGPVYYGGQAGPADDLVLQVDTTPPTASTLIATSAAGHGVTLLFSPTVEAHFARYEIRCSPDSLVDDQDLLWSSGDDPGLATQTNTTAVLGLEYGRVWTFQLWAVDLAGNRSPSSNLASRALGGSAPAPIADLRTWLDEAGLHLRWSPPASDTFGQPVAVQGYRLYSSTSSYFTPGSENLLRTQTTTGADFPPITGDGSVAFRVSTEGAGPGAPSTGRVVGWGSNPSLPSPAENHDLCAVAAGNGQRLALRTDGRLIAWGREVDFGPVPEPDTLFQAIACGSDFNLALRRSGSILAWGPNALSLGPIPEPNRGFIAIAAGRSHVLALRADGHLVAWGIDNYYGQTTLPAPDTLFTAIAAGGSSSGAVTVGGQLLAWGRCGMFQPSHGGYAGVAVGDYMILGLGRNSSVEVLRGQANAPYPNYGYTAVACGINYSGLALRRNGIVTRLGGYDDVPYPNGEQTAIAVYDTSMNSWYSNPTYYVVRNVPLP
jgi:alpha-tubulin suppressor-like RCC1 family protein